MANSKHFLTGGRSTEAALVGIVSSIGAAVATLGLPWMPAAWGAPSSNDTVNASREAFVGALLCGSGFVAAVVTAAVVVALRLFRLRRDGIMGASRPVTCPGRPAFVSREPSMRLRGLSILLVTLPLVACQSAPDTGLHAAVAGSHLDDGQGRIDTFRVTEVDGHPIGRVGTSEPSKTLGIDAVETIAAGRKVHIEFEGLARFSNTAKSLFYDPMRVEGAIDFVPEPDVRYVVRGQVGAAEGSTVWIEDDRTHAVVGRKFVAAPRSAPSAPESRM
jgi:hypothetical protein